MSDPIAITPELRGRVAAAFQLDRDRTERLLEYYNEVDLWGRDYINRVLRILFGRTIAEIHGLPEEPS